MENLDGFGVELKGVQLTWQQTGVPPFWQALLVESPRSTRSTESMAMEEVTVTRRVIAETKGWEKRISMSYQVSCKC